MKRNLSPEAAERQYKAQQEWRKLHSERISVDVPKGMRDVYKAKADRRGVSLSRLIIDFLDSLD